MIQIFFYISMITVAALLIYMFWSISDNYDKESIMVRQIRRKSIIRNNRLSNLNRQKYVIINSSDINTNNLEFYNLNCDNRNNNKNINNNNNNNNLPRNTNIVKFYDFDKKSVNRRISDSHNNDCA